MSALDLRRLQRHLRDSLRRHAAATRAGPFTCYLHPESPDPALNVAVPDEPVEGRRVPVLQEAAGDAAPVAADDPETGLVLLRAHFAANRRLPRVEFVDALHPGLPELLARHGFRETSRATLVACTPATWRQVDPPAGARVEPILPDSPWASVKSYLEVQREAYALDMPLPASAPPGFWPALQLAAGILVTVDGEPAAAGGITPVEDGLADVRGLAVREAFRGRGLGGFLLSALGQVAHGTGVEALVAVPDDARTQRLAARAGFAPAATLRSFTAEAAAAP
ncbi:MAG TPA: GNAT family N-acetyltransferase [Candidatus Thermoplasmatota archaeon]|nr:GNAT family N-acetyltransferase [Candidatus Thermoplasmatota archaeon]